MQLYTIDTGYFKLDGGAMFGIVPQSIWKNLNAPDEKNLCTWALRCLLIETGNRLALIDTGIGSKQGERFMRHFQPHGDDTLVKSLNKHGFSPEDITDVLLTHLHFDHCGGAINLNTDGKPEIAFPNARYWSSAKHWKWATEPNIREKASFLHENIMPILESGQLSFTEDAELDIDGLSYEFVHGHTDSMMIFHISGYKGRTISYAADLIPSRHHIRMPYIMAYDVRPLHTLSEKAVFLEKAIENDHVIMFEHDLDVECCTLTRTEKGIIFNRTFALSEI